MKTNKICICIILAILIASLVRITSYASTTIEQTKPNGIYKIAVAKNASKSVEVLGGDISNNVPIDIWDYGNAAQQKFYFEYQKEGYYKITAMHTGKSMTVSSENMQEGAEIIQADYQGLNSQKWVLRDSKKNGWVISPLVNLELALSINETVKNGAKLVLSKTEDNENQMFYLFNISTDEQTKPNGIYKIAAAKDASKAIEVMGANKENNATVDIWQFGNATQQKFYFEYQKEGYYKITAMHTGKSLTAKNNNVITGTEIVQYDYQGLNSQKWLIRDSKKNGWIIYPLSNPQLSISIEETVKNGAKLILSKTKDNEKQMYYVFNISAEEQTKTNGVYKISVGKDEGKTVEVMGADKANNAIVDIWDYGNVSQQKFYFEYQKEGYYKITAAHTGKSLTVKNNNISNKAQIVQDEYRGDIGQKWLITDSKINGWVISPLSRPDLAISIENKIVNGAKIILEDLQNNNRQLFYLYKAKIAVNIDSSKYPGIEGKINELSILHPNWKFEILYTTLDFNKAVEEEYKYEGKRGNLVYTPTYKGDWIAPSPYVSGCWASASYNGIAYFMDPRNFLNDVDIFQFIDLSDYSSSGVTLKAIQYQVDGTFLQNNAEDVMTACKNANINPYYALARLFQEQGREGSITINMDGQDGNLYYNPFNIGAEVGNDYQTALNRAKKEGWNSMAKGIEGGIRIIKSYYIDKKQNTLYLNKFDVNPASGGGFYNHQYMQNLSAAYSEARILNGAYVDTRVLDNEIKFIIPVYENMPEIASEKPTGKITVQYNNENINSSDRIKVKTNDGSGVNVRSGAGTSYGIIRSVTDGTTGTRIVTDTYNADGLWWDEVIFDDGTRGFVATNYLVKIS